MKPAVGIPFFEVGIKNYLYGDDVLKLALTAEAAAERYDLSVMMIVPYAEIRCVAEHTKRLVVLAPYMDLLAPGRGMADVLPEALYAAGARGVVLNHCEKSMTMAAVQQAIGRANELGMLSFVCADSIEMGRALAHFHPDIINPEPTELIGSGKVSDLSFVEASNAAIHAVDPMIMVEQAAGVSTPEQVYEMIMAGAQGVGVASGICKSKDPCAMLDAMAHSVRMAFDARTRNSITE